MSEVPPTLESDPQLLLRENERLRARLSELQARLKEPEEIIRAIRFGEVDAFVVTEPPGERIYSLRAADGLYRVLVEEMMEGAVALDSEGIILYCNWHFATLMKAKRESIVGTSIYPFVPDECRPAFSLLEQADLPDTARLESCMRAGDGATIPVMLAINRIPLDEQTVYCLIVTDLSEQKRQEELLTAAHRKDAFLAMLSHELRNPIAPIRNAAHVLRLKDLSPPDLRWAGEVIERQVRQLSHLVDDLLDVARISSGKISLRMDVVDMRGVISAATEETRPVINARQHELSIELPSGPLLVQGDQARLTQVVANLLGNAAKFTPPKGRISIVVERRQDDVVVRVRDTGVGIAPDMLQRIFDFFMQADSSEQRAEEGLGIGLALVKTLVEMHGGKVAAASAGTGQGSEFTLSLPLLRDIPPDEPESAAGNEASEPSAPCCVLVVDDNRDAAETLALLIRQWKHEAYVATTPDGALELAREHSPDVVFTDIGMPGMDGYALARKFRQMPGLKRAVLVALTGYGNEKDRRRSQEAGFDHHWIKPASLDDVESLLRSVGK
jgi:PAS domain S-box-containing protein